MTEQEIERCLERFAMGKACDVMNFDYAGTLVYIERLKAENVDLHERLKETEHRAEVAERALLHALEAAISDGQCPECIIKFAGNCKGTVKDIRDCAALDVEDYLQQAEKELQGGGASNEEILISGGFVCIYDCGQAVYTIEFS